MRDCNRDSEEFRSCPRGRVANTIGIDYQLRHRNPRSSKSLRYERHVRTSRYSRHGVRGDTSAECTRYRGIPDDVDAQPFCVCGWMGAMRYAGGFGRTAIDRALDLASTCSRVERGTTERVFKFAGRTLNWAATVQWNSISTKMARLTLSEFAAAGRSGLHALSERPPCSPVARARALS